MAYEMFIGSAGKPATSGSWLLNLPYILIFLFST